MFALLLLGCDAAEEGRGPGTYPAGLTTSTTTTGSATGETTSSGTTGDDTTSGSATTGDSTSSTTADTGDDATTDVTTSTSTSTSTTGDATTTGEGTTTSGDPPCPCLPEIQAGQNLCGAQPTPECPATMPGGLCDPNGDGSYADADWIAGYKGYLESCA